MGTLPSFGNAANLLPPPDPKLMQRDCVNCNVWVVDYKPEAKCGHDHNNLWDKNKGHKCKRNKC